MRYYDNTMLSDFKRCPRYYYYRHVRAWVQVGFPAPLAFGGAWHSAMDVLWAKLNQPELTPPNVVDSAYDAWLDTWENEYGGPRDPSPVELEHLGARTPGTALEMLYNYKGQRENHIRSLELIAVERPFLVPLDPQDADLWYAGKLDKTVRERKRVRVYEHKTTSAYAKAGGIKSGWMDSWSPNSQIDGYLFAGPIEHGSDFHDVVVDGALVHRSVHDCFKVIPIERDIEHLNAWLWEARFWIRLVEEQLRVLDSDEILIDDKSSGFLSFPKNTNSCFDFNRPCPYIGMCKAWTDPRGRDMPQGFEHSKWSPFDHNQLAKLMEITNDEVSPAID